MSLIRFGTTTLPTSGETTADRTDSTTNPTNLSNTEDSHVQEVIHRTGTSRRDEADSSSSRLEIVVPHLLDEREAQVRASKAAEFSGQDDLSRKDQIERRG